VEEPAGDHAGGFLVPSGDGPTIRGRPKPPGHPSSLQTGDGPAQDHLTGWGASRSRTPTHPPFLRTLARSPLQGGAPSPSPTSHKTLPLSCHSPSHHNHPACTQTLQPPQPSRCTATQPSPAQSRNCASTHKRRNATPCHGPISTTPSPSFRAWGTPRSTGPRESAAHLSGFLFTLQVSVTFMFSLFSNFPFEICK